MSLKEKTAIVFTLSSNLTFSVACVMLDLKNKSLNILDKIVIIHDGISLKDQNILNSIWPVRFILYDFPIKDTTVFNKGTLNYFTKMVFAKFECLKLLNDYHTVLLLDSDIVILQDISELLAPCETGIKMMRAGVSVRAQLCNDVLDYDMDALGVSAGTFVLNDNLKNYMEMYSFCYESLVKYANSLYMPEQAIFDFMIQEFNLEICPIDIRVYSPHPNAYKEQAKILHAYGQPKFWNGLNNEQWNQNYKQWLNMGGQKYRTPSLFAKLLKKIKYKIGL